MVCCLSNFVLFVWLNKWRRLHKNVTCCLPKTVNTDDYWHVTSLNSRDLLFGIHNTYLQWLYCEGMGTKQLLFAHFPRSQELRVMIWSARFCACLKPPFVIKDDVDCAGQGHKKRNRRWKVGMSLDTDGIWWQSRSESSSIWPRWIVFAFDIVMLWNGNEMKQNVHIS